MTEATAPLDRGGRDWRLAARRGALAARRRWYQARSWAARRTVRAAVPGWAGALAVSWGVGGLIGHTVGHGLTPWAAFTLTGVFLLRLDSRL